MSNFDELISSDISSIYGISPTLKIPFPKYLIIMLNTYNEIGNQLFKEKWVNTLNKTIKGYYYIENIVFETDYQSTIIKLDCSFNINSDIWESIESPISVSEHYHEEYKKHIYLFGDFHIEGSECQINKKVIDFIKFTDKTIRYNNEKFIDVFVEVPYGFLATEIHYLEKYYNKLKNSKLKNVRLHYTDMRTIEEKSMSLLSLFKILRHPKSDINSVKLAIQKLISLLLNMNGTYTFDFVYQLHDINKKILKQINNVEEPMRSIIANFFRKEHSIYTKSYVLGKLYEFLNNVTKSTQKLNEFIVKWEGFVLDIYIVSRMYRKFRKVDNKYSETPNNIIVYAGEAHIRVIRKFMNELKVDKVNEDILYINEDFTLEGLYKVGIEKGYFNCVDISKFRQPFFYINDNNYLIEPDKLNISPNYYNQIDDDWISLQKSYISKLDIRKKYVVDNFLQLKGAIHHFINNFKILDIEISNNIAIQYFIELYIKSDNIIISEYQLKIALIYYYLFLKDTLRNSPKSKKNLIFYHSSMIKRFMYENNYIITDLTYVNIKDYNLSEGSVYKMILTENLIYVDGNIIIDDQLILSALLDTKLIGNIYYTELSK